MSAYHIPKQRTRVEIKVSNSRFIATVAAVFSVKEAQAFLREIRKEMPDATHHVYAFKIGHGASVSEGLSDDGEPSGTAGPPAMAVLRGSDLGDVALVITRYFGGTRLGTGGLVSAYSDAAKAAFEALETEPKVLRVGCTLEVPYALLESVRRTLAAHNCLVDDECFEALITLRLQVPQTARDALARELREMSGGRLELGDILR